MSLHACMPVGQSSLKRCSAYKNYCQICMRAFRCVCPPSIPSGHTYSKDAFIISPCLLLCQVMSLLSLEQTTLTAQLTLQEVVKSSRGEKLDTSNEDELWSGRVWTGRQAAQLGLIDAVGTMESVCKQKFGEKVESALTI